MNFVSKMYALTIDSSVFISDYQERDIFHKESRAFFRALGEIGSVVIPAMVPFEVCNALVRYKVEFDSTTILINFSQLQLVDVDLELISHTIPILSKFYLKASDALLVAVAALHKTTLISWDKQLLKEAARVVPAMTPTEYLKGLEINNVS